jgi:hypothetical protein
MPNFFQYLLLGSTVLLIYVIYWHFVAGRRAFASASNCFLLIQTLFLVGSILAVDLSEPLDRIWVWALVGGFAAFTLGGAAINLARRFRPAQEIEGFCSRPFIYDLDTRWLTLAIVVTAVVCVIVGVIYSSVVGFNVFFSMLTDSLNTGTIFNTKYSDMETNISANRYIAAGYSAQFAGVILPLVLTLMFFRIRMKHRGGETAFALILLPAAFYFMTITGNRVWFVFAVAQFALMLTPYGPFPRFWRASKKPVLMALLAFVLFYGVSTALMGRAGTDVHVSTLSEGIINELYGRVVGLQTEAHVVIMRDLLERPVQWGGEWWGALKSIRPGHGHDYTFQTELYALAFHGATNGSMQLEAWASFVYNWGVLGSMIVAFLAGVLMQEFTITYVRGGRSLSRAILLFAAGFRLALFHDPYGLLLQGFLTTIIYYFILRLGQLPYRNQELAMLAARQPSAYDDAAGAIRGTVLNTHA